jgi:hypothetical protein
LLAAPVCLPILGCDSVVDAYRERELASHRATLEDLLRQKAPRQEVDRQFGEPYRVASPDDAVELARFWPNPNVAVLERKIRTWPVTLVYLRESKVYFVFLDYTARVSDYECISN